MCSHLFLCIHTVYKNKRCEARIPPHLLGHKETENLDHWRCPRKHGKTPKIQFYHHFPYLNLPYFFGKSQISSSCAHWGPSHHFLGFRDDCWPDPHRTPPEKLKMTNSMGTLGLWLDPQVQSPMITLSGMTPLLDASWPPNTLPSIRHRGHEAFVLTTIISTAAWHRDFR